MYIAILAPHVRTKRMYIRIKDDLLLEGGSEVLKFIPTIAVKVFHSKYGGPKIAHYSNLAQLYIGCNFFSCRSGVHTHCYFTRLNPERISPFQFCLPEMLGIHRNPKQKEFLKSTEGFLRAALTVAGHPSPV